MGGWVYSRKLLAEKYLKALDIGLINRLALFAPRRRGKTLYLMNDLAPLSEKNGYYPVYVNLWDNIESPHLSILEALRNSLKIIKKRGKLSTLLTTPIQKLSLGNTALRAEIAFSSPAKKASSNELSEIGNLISTIANYKKAKKLLLMIDEIQHLTTNKQFEPLIFALRTAADRNPDKVKIVFTGSSRSGMRQLFNQSNAAFYNSVERMDFPVMEPEFITFCQNKVKTDHSITLSTKALTKVFNSLDQSPYWFIKVLHKVILHQVSLNKALSIVRDEIFDVENYLGIYNSLNPLDIQVLLAITTTPIDLFSTERAKSLSQSTGKKIKIPNIQYTVNKLIKKQLITKMGRGEYVLEKPSLVDYIRGRQNR